jgi:CheY-like chemotaxis protein
MRMKEPLDPDLRWCRDVIERQANQLTRLVDDLLDVSRITRGKIKLQMETLELRNVIDSAVETSRPVIDGQRHYLKVSFPDRPIRIEGDLTRLTQVVANLLNNAAKYQNEGGRIELTVSRAPAAALISVRDRGVGIAPGMLAQIFELFSQGERSPDRAQGGLGIGLSLVKNLVEMHGGSVHAVSEGLGRGSEFVVRLPCLAENPAAIRSVEVDSAALELSPPLRILVVDDSQDAAESLAKLLRLGGHEVLVANDGIQALEIAAAERPAVVLLDIGLPGMDGYEVCRRVRQQGLSDARIIAVTGYGQERDRQRSRDAGFDTHTVKPVDPAELMKLVAGH